MTAKHHSRADGHLPTQSATRRDGASILFIEADQVLLVRRDREPYRGCWSLPGGSVEPGETAEQAARREAMEETGLTVETLEFAAQVDMPARPGVEGSDPGFRLHVFRAVRYAGRPRAGDDAAQLRWHDIARLDELAMTPGTARFIKRMHRANN